MTHQPHPIPAFTRREYDDRLTRTRAAMQRRNIDVLIVSDPSNMAWLTGYDGWSFYTHQAVVIGQAGEPIWWGRGMDALGARRTVWMNTDNILGYDDTCVQNPDKHPMRDLASVLEQRGLARGTLGVELDNYYYSAAADQALRSGLANATLADATGLVNWQRAVKSDTEIACMRAAARIVEHMHQRILDTAEPGMPKHLLVAEIYRSAIAGTDGIWGDYPAIVPLTPSGLDATAPHLTWDDKPIQANECTFFEIAGVHRRYHCPQSRTLFFNRVPDRYRRAEAAVLEAIEAGLAEARPGNRCEDIANAFNRALNRAGFHKDSRAGYAIGLSYPPDWGERTMSFRAGDSSVLEVGMTFHFMPALWLDDGGLEITESILITESGAECLCNTPREVFVKD
ncbi:MAG: M24 family metallopeptidase [Pseudomonadota bacterium]